MSESVKDILRKFLMNNPGKCFSGFELVKEKGKAMRNSIGVVMEKKLK
jgi:hypothetical protein